MEELLKKIVLPLLDDKEALRIVEVPSDKDQNSAPSYIKKRCFELVVNPDDMGRVIGNKGNIIKAIRTVAKSLSYNPNERIIVKVREPLGESEQSFEDGDE